jgi:5-methylcytosine-specific restriction endonuclease McrA
MTTNNYTPISKSKRLAVWDKTGGTCWYCGDSLDFGEYFHPDHVIARAKGGTNHIDNLVPCCPPCNHRKHAHSIEGFRDVMSRKPEYLWFSKTQKQWIKDMTGLDVDEINYKARYVFWFERQGLGDD